MTKRYVKAIQKTYPLFEVNTAELNEIGQNNDVVIINRQYVFRFPKYSKGVHKLIHETRLLKRLQQTLPIRIPLPAYESFEASEIGEIFIGYKMLPGQPLWRETFSELEWQRKREIAEQLSSFLDSFHSIPKEEIALLPGQVSDQPRQQMVDMYERVQKELFPFMREEARSKVAQHFEHSLSDDQMWRFETTLIHGDFGASNLLWIKEEGIIGVIDFAEARIGDPAYDFAGLLASYGEDFVRQCLCYYPNEGSIYNRVTFYKGTFALQEALHGAKVGDSRAFENGIRDYR